jgi:hypothetical protein
MYCSSCGAAVAQQLTYCNNCGAKQSNEKTDSLLKTTELRYDSFIMSAMVGLFVLGLVATSVLLGVMKSVLQFPFGPLVAFALLSFLMLIGIEGILISRLFRGRTGKSKPDVAAPPNITRELEAPSRIASEPAGSVTDQTTRTLDPIYNERR